MIAPVGLRSNWGDLYGSSMLPALEQLFNYEMRQYPSLREQLFKVIPHDRDIWQSSESHDMPLFNQVDEGSDYTFKAPKQGANKTLSIVKYGLGGSISKEMIEDGKFDMVGDMVRKLVKSGRESQEIQAMNMFNNGFTSETTPDGQYLFSASHVAGPSGLTFRNQLSTPSDLSASTLDTMLTDFATQFYGDSGIFYSVAPKVLLVHPSNFKYAKELVGSDLKPDTAENNMNSLKEPGLRVVQSPHLTDSDAWFLLSEPLEHGLRIISRAPLAAEAGDRSLGFINDSFLFKASYREAVGATHALGVFGTAGA